MQEPIKFCSTCGAQNNLSAPFCHECATGFTGEPGPSQPSNQHRMKIHPGVWALLVVLTVILFGFILLEPRPGAAPAETAIEVTPTPWTLALSNYYRLQTGMSYEQACDILSKSGTEISRSEMAGYVTVMYSWKGDGVANAMFQNGKLISKAQFGLK
jgi:hypothetical protein